MTRWLLYLLIGFAGGGSLAAAQDANAPFARWTAPTQPVLIGEPFILQLEIVLPPDSELVDPTPPSVWGDYWLVPLAPMEMSQQADGTRRYQQRFNATLWNTGQLATPELTLTYRLMEQGSEQTLQLPSITVVVNSVLNPDDLNLRPMRPPLVMMYVPPLMIAAIGVLVLVLAYMIWQIIRGRRMTDRTATSLTPARLALEELNRLARLDDPVRVHLRVADVLRRFIGARVGLTVMDLTTEELLQCLPPTSVPEARRLELQQLLEYADLVKFAQVKPGPGQRIVGAARRWVSEVEGRDHA
jgi:hypothetical protein